MEEPDKKPRKTRSDKGIPRPDRVRRATGFRDDVVKREGDGAPVWVKLELKNGAKVEFGCTKHQVANGFRVFFYPSERDRYRTTRLEFAISEIVVCEITAADVEEPQGQIFDLRPETVEPQPLRAVAGPPRIHNARAHAARTMEALATGNGPVKMDELPSTSIGSVVGVGGIGDSLG